MKNCKGFTGIGLLFTMSLAALLVVILRIDANNTSFKTYKANFTAKCKASNGKVISDKGDGWPTLTCVNPKYIINIE